jgi:hypothetical protein
MRAVVAVAEQRAQGRHAQQAHAVLTCLGGRPRFRVANRANPWPWLSIASK